MTKGKTITKINSVPVEKFGKVSKIMILHPILESK